MSWVRESGEAELGLRLGAALREFWRLGGDLRAGLRWLEELLALPAAAAPTLPRARALTAAADLSSWIGEPAAYLRLAEEATSIYRDLRDDQGVPDALAELGVAQMLAGRLAAARATFQEARERNLGLGNRQRAGECAHGLGVVALLEGRPQEARKRFEDALATFEDLRDRYWSAFTQRMLGHADRLQGDDEAAEKWYRAGLLASRQHDLPVITASVLYAFADLALARSQHERAVRLAGASKALRERLGEVWSFETYVVGDVAKAARRFLGEATADSLFEEGRAMGVEDAVAYALQQPPT